MHKEKININNEISKNRQTLPFQYIDCISIDVNNKSVYGKFNPLVAERYYSDSLLPLLCLESMAQMSSILIRFVSKKKSGGYLTQVDKLNYLKKITTNNIVKATIKVHYLKKEANTSFLEVSIKDSEGLIAHGFLGVTPKDKNEK